MKATIAASILKPAIKSTSASGVTCKVCFLLTSSSIAAVKQTAETIFSGVNFTFKL